jgi:hypothetical protein
LVWDFGQLPEEEEKSHILSMVKAEDLFSEKKRRFSLDKIKLYNQRLAGFIHRIHKAVRDIEERSGVSLRDIKRVFLFFKWFRSQMPCLMQYYESDEYKEPGQLRRIQPRTTWIFDSEDNQDIASAICSIIICYCLKMNGQQENQKKLYDIIHSWSVHAIGVRSLARTEALSCLNTISELYLHQIENKFIEKNIAVNNPFKENFMTLLACYAVKVPLIIVGAPGTSKTLCSSVLMRAVGPEKNDPTLKLSLFKSIETGSWFMYCGSEATTPTIISRIFGNVYSLYQPYKLGMEQYEEVMKDNESLPDDNKKALPAVSDLPGIFFDELGLAEISPHNPLKVMHSKLEEFLGMIPFISISNWRPDQSKINRMVCLSRPDLTKSDLTDIFSNTFKELHFSTILETFFREAIEKMSQCYLNYREWQKHTNPNKMYHKNFHGSRDIYSTVKFIMHKIAPLIEGEKERLLNIQAKKQKLDHLSPEDKADIKKIFRQILNCFKDGIQRNLNGEVYKFGDNPAEHRNVPEMISTECLKASRGRELIHETFYQSHLQNFLKEKKMIETLDEYLEVNFLRKNRRKSSDPKQESLMCSLSSAEIFKAFFMNLIYMGASSSPSFACLGLDDGKFMRDFLNDGDIMRSINDNITTPSKKGVDCRFIAVRSEGSIMDDFLVDRLRKMREDMRRKKMKTIKIVEGKETVNKEDVIKGLVDLRAANTSGKVEDILAELKTYITEGYLVVMKNLDHIYAGLYELFNQKDEKCDLYYGLTPHPVEVHPNFKCVVILPTGSNIRRNNQIEKVQPAPFLNRFEKYYLALSSILPMGWMDEVQDVVEKAKNIVAQNPSFFLGYNIDTLVSMVITDSVLKISAGSSESRKRPEAETKERKELDAMIKSRFYKLVTKNYLVSVESLTLTDIKAVKAARTGKSFPELLAHRAQGQQPAIKHFVFTFTGSKRLKGIVGDTTSGKPWLIINSDDIMKGGDFKVDKNLSKLIQEREKTSELMDDHNEKTNLIISFELPTDFDIIRQLKNLFDQGNQTEDAYYKKFKVVIFMLHVSRSAVARQFLNKSLGISYSQGWDIVVIDSLEPTFNYEDAFEVRKKTISEAVLVDCLLEENNDEEEGDDNQMEDHLESVNLHPQKEKMGERVLRRVLISIVEKLTYQQKELLAQQTTKTMGRPGLMKMGKKEAAVKVEKDFDFKGLREFLLEPRESFGTVNFFSAESQKFLSKLAKLILNRLNASKGVQKVVSSVVKTSESYTDIELHLGQLFYNSYQQELAEVLTAVNKHYRNLTSLVRGLMYFSNSSTPIDRKDQIVADYFETLDYTILEVDSMVESKTLGKLSIPNNEAKVLYLPQQFREALKPVQSEFAAACDKFDSEKTAGKDLKANAIKVYKHTVSLLKSKNQDVKFVAGTEEDKKRAINSLQQEEEWIVKEIGSIFIRNAGPVINHFGIEFSKDAGALREFMTMLIVDWLNKVAYGTLADNYSFDTLSEFVDICFALTNPLPDQDEESKDTDLSVGQKEFIRRLATATILTFFFSDVAKGLLEQITNRSDHSHSLFSSIIKEKTTLVNYAGLFDLEAKLLAINHQIDLQKVTKAEIRKLAASMLVSQGRAPMLLGLLYQAVTLLPDKSFSRYIVELRSKLESTPGMETRDLIDFNDLIDSSKPIMFEILELIRQAKTNMLKLEQEKDKNARMTTPQVSTDLFERLKLLAAEHKRLMDCVSQYFEMWLDFKVNLYIFEDEDFKKLLEDRQVISSQEYKEVVLKSIKKACTWVPPFWEQADLAKAEAVPSLLDITTKIKKNGYNELDSLDKFIKRTFKEPSLRFALFSFLETLYDRISLWNVDEKIEFSELLDQAMKIYLENLKTPNLPYLLSILVIRRYFNENKIRNLSNQIDREKIEEIVCKGITSDPDHVLQNIFKPEIYPFAFFLQSIQNGTITTLKAVAERNYKGVATFISSLPTVSDPNQILVFNEGLNAEYMKLKDEFRQQLESHNLPDPALKEAAFQKLVAMFEQPTLQSVDTTLYLLGVAVLNILIKDPQTQKEQEEAKKDKKKVHTFFLEAFPKAPQNSKFARLCQMMLHLVADGEVTWVDLGFLLESTFAGQGLQAKKVLAMMGLLVICFDKMQYKPDSWTKWTSHISTDDFRCVVGINRYTENASAILDNRTKSRLLDPGMKFYYDPLISNLGMYSCRCGFIYVFDNCGYAVSQDKTPDCSWKIFGCTLKSGGKNHNKDMEEGQTHLLKFQNVIDHLAAKHKEACGVYSPHVELNDGSRVYRILLQLQPKYAQVLDKDIFTKVDVLSKDGKTPSGTYTTPYARETLHADITKYEESQECADFLGNLYFRHLFDHMFLAVQRLFMPQDKWKDFDKVASESLKNAADILYTPKFKRAQAPQQYWMSHIENDLQRISTNLKLDPKTKVLEWLRRAMSHMGEMIITNQAEDPTTKLFLNRTLFPTAEQPTLADQAVCEQKDISLKRAEIDPSARAVTSFISLHLAKIPSTIADQAQLLLSSKLFRVNPPSMKNIDFLEKLKERMREPSLKVVEAVYKYQTLIAALPETIAPVIEICRLVQQEFTRKITVKEAMDSKILDSDLCRNKTKLIDLFSKFKKAGAQILRFLQGDYGEVFDFAVGCQRNIENIDKILELLTSDDATVYYFILGSGSEEMLEHQRAIKAIILAFINKIHNMVSLACLSALDGELPDDQAPASKKSDHVLSIKNSTYADYVCISQDFDLAKLAEKHTSFDPENGMELVIDTLKLRQELSRMLYKPQIQAEPGDFDEFVYCDKLNMSGISREIRRYFNYASVEQIGTEEKKIIKDDKLLRDQDDVETRLKNIIDLISSICRYLHTGLKYTSFGNPLLQELENCSHESETQDKLLRLTTEVIDQLGLDKQITVGKLLPLFEELKKISYDTFVPAQCSKPLGELKSIVDGFIKFLKTQALKDPQCAKLIESVKDQVFEHILSGYPSTSHLKAKIAEVGVDLDPIEEEIESTTDPEKKHVQKEFLDNITKLLEAIRYDQWGSIQDLFK